MRLIEEKTLLAGRRVAAGFAVAVDVALRFLTIWFAVELILEFAQYWNPAPNGDGFPVVVAIPPLAAYVGWNLAVLAWSLKWLKRGEQADPMYLIALAALAVPRLLFFRWLAADLWYSARGDLWPLILGSTLSFALSLFVYGPARKGFLVEHPKGER